MPTTKLDLIAALSEIATLMDLAGENPFSCRAFEQGARILESLPGEPEEWIASGVLSKTKGIGKGLTERIVEWHATGAIAQLATLRAEIPAGLAEMRAIPSLGPKKAKVLWKEKGIDTIEKLEAAARSGALNDLAGFGEKTAAKIIAGIEQRQKYSARHTLLVAQPLAREIYDRLRAVPQVGKLELAGSLRRVRETIKDLDFIATSDEPAAVMKAFLATPGIAQVVAQGETKCSILLSSGVPVDLRVVAPESFAAALMYFTGSKGHNTALRGRAKRMGLKLNEYGLFREPEGDLDSEVAAAGAGKTPPLPAETEADIYRHLGMAYVEPELRENLGEIEAAEKGTLPKLIQTCDMRGVLHCHTTYSDGKMSVEELARACQSRGYKYLAICDHSPTAAYAGGLKVEALLRQWDEIDAVNAKLKDFKIFKGTESDILGEGELDYPDDILARLDVVVVSIHSRMSMDRDAMTARVCRALEHPATTIFGHPTARLLLQREPVALDMDRMIETAAKHNVVLEINTHPYRLDLDWHYIRQAKKAGCKFAINPDAHSEKDLEWIPLGVGIARKGWLEAEDVINTMDARGFEKWLEKRPK